MATIKEMAALDRHNYQKLVPMHLQDMRHLPADILMSLRKGGCLLGRRGHSVGVDKAHEMCINRQCKEYITPLCREHQPNVFDLTY